MVRNSITLEATVQCPKTNTPVRYCSIDCCKCMYHEGAYADKTTECWYGVADMFDLALLKLKWNDDKDRMQLPVPCRPFKAEPCRFCDKFATDACYARIKRNRRG